jgi:glycosyltransferase involved in cell wall biosynthesis
MRVLWLTNILPDPLNQRFGNPYSYSGSWIDALRIAMEDKSDIELGIAATSEMSRIKFVENRTFYYSIPIPKQNGTFSIIQKRWHHNSENEKSLRICLDIINEFKPDLIHIHGSENFFGRVIQKTNVPVVISLQGIVSVCEKFFWGKAPAIDSLLDNISINFIKGTSSFHKYLLMKNDAEREREIIKLCSNFIGRTEFDHDFVSLVNPNSNYFHCDEILRPTFYKSNWEQKKALPFTVYCTTRPNMFKGLDCLIDAFQILHNYGFKSAHLRIGGPIPDSSLWSYINRRLKQSNLTSQYIDFLGKLDAEEIRRELEVASVFVLPSYVDNSPNSLMEAMLLGTPCIASNVGGVPSIVEDNINGLLFPSGDPYSLASKIIKIWNNPDLAQKLSLNARNLSLNRNDPYKITKKMEGIYKEIITHNKYRD